MKFINHEWQEEFGPAYYWNPIPIIEPWHTIDNEWLDKRWLRVYGKPWSG